jgi:putative DNA primase/helicase
MSASEAIADFISFMEANGVVPADPIAQRLASGNLIRFRCDGDGKGRQNGWAILYLDERPAGAFGNYRLNTGTLKWKSDADRPALSASEREALRKEWRDAKDRREAEQRENERQAALDAAEMWRRAAPASADHPYVARKQIDPTPLKQLGDQLLIPMYAADGFLWNLQRINPDGEKRFLRGGRVDDLFCFVGEFTAETSEAVIAEGYATADAVHQATGLPAIASFSAKNMLRVARVWNQRRPDLSYTIFGDDDRATEEKTGKNPGREAALAAALEIGAKVAFPLGRAA